MAHTVYGTKQQLTFHHTDSLCVKEVHFDYGAASNGGLALLPLHHTHSYDILGAGMLWKPKEARILTNFNEF
jgi:hypothetical protein